MSDWEPVGKTTSNDGWEPVGGGFLDKAAGVIEGPLSVASGLLSAIPTGIRTLGELAATGDVNEALSRAQSTQEASTYTPRSKTGKAIANSVNNTLGEYQEDVANKFAGDTAFLNQEKLRRGEQLTPGDLAAENKERTLGEIVGSLYAPGIVIPRRGVKAPLEEAPKSKAAEVFDKQEVAKAAEDGWQPVGSWGIKNGEKVPASELTAKQKEILDKRQPKAGVIDPMQAMAEQLAGDKLPTTEASVPIDRMARELQTFDAIGQMLRGDEHRTLLDRAREPKPEAPAPQEPIYVDPQGQAFRGNPADPNAVRALDRQTDAFTQEMWRRPEERASDGEPLTPLTDVTREPREPIPEDQLTPNASREYELKEQPISSAGPRGRQRGAVNPDVLKEGFLKLKNLASGLRLAAVREPGGFSVLALDSNNKEVGRVQFDPVEKHSGDWVDAEKYDDVRFAPENYNLESGSTFVDEGHRRQGLAREMYKFASELGNDIQRSFSISEDGKAMWKGFEDSGLATRPEDPHRPIIQAQKPSQTGVNVPLKQRGAVGDLRNNPARVDSAKLQKQQQMAKNFKSIGLDEWDVIKTKDEALAMAKDAPDISKDYGQKSLVSGINMEAALTNNPILKFARTVFKDSRAWMDQMSRKYVTSNDTGLSHLWPKFSTEQRINLMDALMEADKRQVELTDRVMDEMGFTPAMKQFAKTFRDADEVLLKKQNENAAKLGLEETDRRVGHFPGIFTGSYKTLVVVDKGGKKQAVAVLATDTKAQQKLAQEYAKKNFPDATFIEQERAGLAGVSNRYYSDIFSGWNDVLNLLGREDPRFAEVTSIVDKAVLDANNRLFNFNVHELAKKGVVGNEGNKPWLSPKENADQAFKALVRYFEEGFQHHALQVPLKEMREIMTAPETDHMPNAKNYLEQYVKKVTGDDLNQLGRAINTILDQPFRFMPNFSIDKNKNVKFGVGVGPSVPMKLSGAIKNNMAQLYMGWFNWMFTAAQMVQPVQTGLPFLQHAASRIGADPMQVAKSMGKGGVDFLVAFTESVGGKEIKGLDPTMREAFKYAKERGMFEFSEIERAYQGTQSRVGRAKDQLAEVNMKLGEQTTRTPMFMAFADLLVSQGIPKERAFPIAENLTQASMIDYHQWERPMVYGKLGVMGGFMSGLTTFKHGLTSQGVYLGKQLVKPVGGAKRSAAVLPLAYATAAAIAFAGITGMPFYNELDSVYRYMTNHLGGEEHSIRGSFLSNSPEWLNSGMVSAASGLNLQSKFSTADMIPDASHPLRAISPYGEGAWNIAKTGYDFAKNRDAQGERNFAGAVTPSGWKGVTENYLSKDENGNFLGKDGLPILHRTEDEWQTRMFTGVRSQREALERQSIWDARSKERSDTERRKEIATEYERRIVNNNMDTDSQQKLMQEYQDRKGDVADLLRLWQKAAIEKQQTEKQRLEGTPNSVRGYNRWEYFQK